MAMTQYNGDPEVISKLGTTPQERGLTTEQFKAKFDEGLKGFVEWFNSTHKTQFDAKAETTSLNALQNEVNAHLAESASKDMLAHVKVGAFADGVVPFVYADATPDAKNTSLNLGVIENSEYGGSNQVYMVTGYVRQSTVIRGRGLWLIHKQSLGTAVATPIFENNMSIDISTGNIILNRTSLDLSRQIAGTVIKIL